tara:strand:- start:610 stop:816 length:207 start_codon:yes stop_codon:yes gene_type:complete
MDDYVKVEGKPNLYKNKLNGFISNFDEDGLRKAKARKKARIEKDQKIGKLEDEVSELKDMVRSLIKDR